MDRSDLRCDADCETHCGMHRHRNRHTIEVAEGNGAEILDSRVDCGHFMSGSSQRGRRGGQVKRLPTQLIGRDEKEVHVESVRTAAR